MNKWNERMETNHEIGPRIKLKTTFVSIVFNVETSHAMFSNSAGKICIA